MAAKRLLPWATALLLSSTPAFAQTTGQNPEPAQPEQPTDPVEPDTPDTIPVGEPEVVEPPPAPEKEVVVEKEVIVEKEVVKISGGKARIGSKWNRDQADQDGKQYLWFLDIGGYIRAGYTGIQNDPTGTFGAHDGFVLANARLGLHGRMRSLGFKLQIDGAVDRNDDANDANAEVVTRLKDANLYWEPIKAVRLTAGQFKPPHDIEEHMSTTEILFVDRSVGSQGVNNVEGRNVEGLSSEREVGIQLGTEHWHFLADEDEKEGPGVSYGVALTNGQNANRALNDNDKLAFYGRAAFHWADLVTVGGGYFLNDRTLGVEPDTIDENVSGWTADLTFTGFGATLIGSVMSQSVSRPDLDTEPETSGFAYQVSVAYKEPFFGFQPAFRFAVLDPTELADDSDALTHMTFGLNYRPDYPIALLLNYTLAQETEDFEIPNNRFDAVLQVTW